MLFMSAGASKPALLVASSILFVIGILVVALSPHEPTSPPAVLMGYAFASLPWGWQALSRVRPDPFLSIARNSPLNNVLPRFLIPWNQKLEGYFLYFAVKLMLSLTIGLFVFPYQSAVLGLAYVRKRKEQEGR